MNYKECKGYFNYSIIDFFAWNGLNIFTGDEYDENIFNQTKELIA